MKILINSGLVIPVFDKRSKLIESMKQKGHQVTISGYQKEGEQICKENSVGYKYIPISRAGLNPIKDIITIYKYYKLIKTEKYDIVHSYTAKPNIYGSIGARLAGVKNIYPTINGLGYAFTGNSLKNKVIRFITCILYKIAFSCSKKVFFQNSDDADEMIKRHTIKKEKCIVISGSGIDLDEFKKEKINNYKTFLFAARLLKTKGIDQFLEAAKTIKEKYPEAEFLVAGALDEENPDGIKKELLNYYIENNYINYLGKVSDMPALMKKCGTFILPSYYREGVPHAILEAMSTGRAIITTNSTGCRETVNGKNGFLIEPKNTNQLVEKIEYIINNKDAFITMCEESRKYAEQRFDVNIVNNDLMKNMNIKKI